MDLEPQHRKILQEIETMLANFAGEMTDMKEYYSDQFDDLSDDEKETAEGEYLSKLVVDMEELCDRLDLAIIDVEALLAT